MVRSLCLSNGQRRHFEPDREFFTSPGPGFYTWPWERLLVSADQRTILVGNIAGYIQFLDATTLKPRGKFLSLHARNRGGGEILALSPNGKELAVAGGGSYGRERVQMFHADWNFLYGFFLFQKRGWVVDATLGVNAFVFIVCLSFLLAIARTLRGAPGSIPLTNCGD